jgi:hypothetical protein
MSQHNTGRTFEESSRGGGNQGSSRKGNMGQVKQGAKEAVTKVKEQATSAVSQQKDTAAQKLDSVSKAFRQSAEGLNEGQVPAVGKLLEQAAESIEGLAQSVRDGDFRGVIDGVEDWARRHPAIFLGGSLVAGLLVARFLKSSREREFGAYDSTTSLYDESGEFESEFEGAGRGAGMGQYGGREYGSRIPGTGISQYGSSGSGVGDVKPGMTVPGTSTPSPTGPVEPSSGWEEQ